MTLGRAASAIANVLMGKHKPIFHPAADCGDHVVVTNCQDVRLMGRLGEPVRQPGKGAKLYYKHSGYPGGLRVRTAYHYMIEDPTFVP